jgi:hypothetical protein
MSNNKEETFGTQVLENRVFTVQWDKTYSEKRTSRRGGSYDVHYIVAEVEEFVMPLTVGPLFGSDWDNLRLLKLAGVTKYTATAGIPRKDGGYVRTIYSGAKA